MTTPVHLKTPFILLAAKQTFFAVRHDVHPLGIDTQFFQITSDRLGPFLAEGQIIRLCAARIRMSFDREAHLGMGLQPFGIRLQNFLIIFPNLPAIVCKEDIPDPPHIRFHALPFLVFQTLARRIIRRRSLGDDHTFRNVLFTGFRPLDEVDGQFAVTLEEESLRKLDLLDEEGRIAGGSRQVQCTVLGNGTAILNLRGEDDEGVPL